MNATKTIPVGTPPPPSKQEQQRQPKLCVGCYNTVGNAVAAKMEAAPELVEAIEAALDRLDLDDENGARLRLRSALRTAGVKP
jgi:hypothetical protein